LAAGQHAPRDVASDGTRVFWIDGPTNAAFDDGAVRWRDVDGPVFQPATLVEGQLDPIVLTMSGTRVVWSNLGKNDGFTGDGNIAWGSVDQPGMTTIVRDQVSAYSMVVDDQIYWTELGNGDGSISRCELDACVPEVLYTGPGMPMALAKSGGTLVWASFNGQQGSSIRACDADACVPWTVSPSGTGPIAADGTDVYFVDGGDIVRCSLTGCAGPAPRVAIMIAPPVAMVVDATTVYFADFTMGGPASIKRCQKSGCDASWQFVAVGPDVQAPYYLSQDADHVFWTDATLGTVTMARK